MVKKENIISGYEIIVNDKRNILDPEKICLGVHDTFCILEDEWIKPKTKIKCLSKVKSTRAFQGKIVEVEISGKKYNVYWMELRIQTDSLNK